MSMFCYQCEQTAKGTGCTVAGVCGKDATTATLQDLLVHATKGVSMYAHRARQLGASDRDVDVFVVEALFATVTNVDFDPERLVKHLSEAAAMRDKAKMLYEDACAKAGKTPETLGGPAAWVPATDLDGLVAQGAEVTILNRRAALGDTVAGLQELVTYGLKGAAAYVDHAHILGKDSDDVYALFHEGLDFLSRTPPTPPLQRGDGSTTPTPPLQGGDGTPPTPPLQGGDGTPPTPPLQGGDEGGVDELVGWALKAGEINMKAMELLDAANTGAYGHPVPTNVRIEPVKGKAIVVSGHDLRDLEELLKQTEGKGINVYTHGEMLPAHGYPKLHAYKHLVGNYGGAWQNQVREFDEFPGAILMTTNCIQRPRESYKGRIFTSGLVAMPGVTHVSNKDFSPVIEAALAAPGFAEDGPDRTITVGFGHEAVMGVAGAVIDAVKSGAIRHFFLIGGCDGAKPGRNYYTEFAQAVPDDCVILTLACGKYRFNKLDFGEIGGIPRLLDIGQCNDAYSAIQIAVALANAIGVGVNDLPLSLILSWYEQKAVAILLTLLHLGIKNIRLGPSLPAFITPDVLDVLVDKFNISPITTPEQDMKAILG